MGGSKQRVNGQINEIAVRLIMPDGEMHANMAIAEARKVADDRELDLVEVSPSSNGNLAVCKILNYDHLRYQQSKKQHHVHKDVTKEVRISRTISEHDLLRKKDQILKFIAKQHKVKLTLALKGRERKNPRDYVEAFKENLNYFIDKAEWDNINISNRAISIMLRPL